MDPKSPIGFGNVVFAHRIVYIASVPMKCLIEEARGQNLLLDTTNGRKTRSIIQTDSGHVILTPVDPDTVAQRIKISTKS
ncbi:extracellular matrix/biofilm biosynthesis regulator RemA family protein [Salicibibacter kimchii]|uniref:DUF370 domain-containing protein n=1 Tax=Salicibibacter kimchii TaxID=2099786 RepID=A0A345C2C9_9BACI|nr:extracellular matrix/biofilm biosynthesis regulator RemA family protein [Salicibibacter kimchii]AXF57360.1 DUF370 domain-containing protein [Salicibibacter kimchii]